MTRYWFRSTQSARCSQSATLAFFTFMLAFIVILLGAYTRLTHAGLSCPDWPRCYGYLTVPHTAFQLLNAAKQYPFAPIDIGKAWTEMTHRYAAATEGILIIILSFSIFFSRRAKGFRSILIAIALIGLLCLQVVLGMLTVTEQLKPMIVLSHLLTGLSILGILWWAYLDLYFRKDAFPINTGTSGITTWLWLALMILIVQIALGGLVSTHSAGLACVDFPYCNGAFIPTMHWTQLNSDLITIHMLHRIGAMVNAIYLSVLALFLFTHPSFKSTAFLILVLLVLQITLGILNIIWLRPISIALAHHCIALILLLTLITALVRASYKKDDRYGFSIG